MTDVIAIPLARGTQDMRTGQAANRWRSAILDDRKWRLENMPRGSFEVAALIAERANKELVCRLSVTTVMAELGIGKSKACAIFRALVDEGWLLRIRYANRKAGLASEYRLSVPARLAYRMSRYIDPNERIAFTNAALARRQDVPEGHEEDADGRREHVHDENGAGLYLDDGGDARGYVHPEKEDAGGREEHEDRPAPVEAQDADKLSPTPAKPAIPLIEPDPLQMTEDEFEAWLDEQMSAEEEEVSPPPRQSTVTISYSDSKSHSSSPEQTYHHLRLVS